MLVFSFWSQSQGRVDKYETRSYLKESTIYIFHFRWNYSPVLFLLSFEDLPFIGIPPCRHISFTIHRKQNLKILKNIVLYHFNILMKLQKSQELNFFSHLQEKPFFRRYFEVMYLSTFTSVRRIHFHSYVSGSWNQKRREESLGGGVGSVEILRDPRSLITNFGEVIPNHTWYFHFSDLDTVNTS